MRRRRLLGLLGTGVVGGLAGCNADEDEPDGIPNSGTALEDSSQVVGHEFPYVTEEYELNPWAPGYLGGFPSLIFEYPSVQTTGGGRRLTDLVEEVQVDETTATIVYSDEFTWWNGEPVTARDRWVARRIDEQIGVDTGGSGVELVDEYAIRYTFESPRRRRLVLADVLDHVHNTPAWLYEEWAEKLEAASSAAEREEIRGSLQSTSVSLSEAAERGIGCGPYELREVSPNRLILERFENHPNADEISVPRAWFPSAREMRAEELTNDGVLDLGQQVLRPNDQPASTPPHVEQLDEHPTKFGTNLLFNWQVDHLARRNVRRAITAVLPLDQVERDAGWGAPARLQTGLSPVVDTRWLDESLRDSLYRYPVERDVDAASEFMHEADYEKRNGRWVGPDGDVAELLFQSPLWDEWSMAAQTIKKALTEFGFRIDVDSYPESSFLGKVDGGDYQMTSWVSTGTPFAAYDLSATRLGGLGYGTTDPDRSAVRGKPVEPTIPTDPGSLDAGDDGRTVNLVDLWQELRRPASTERTREIVGLFARWWNYDLPHLQLATRTTGVWGNTRDFQWPDSGSDAYRTAGPNERIDYYLLRSGAVEPAD